MQEVVWQEDNKIEIILYDNVTLEDFKNVIHQLESLCAQNQKINVMIDAVAVKKYDFKVMMEEYDFYKKYRNHLNRVAIVSDSKFQLFLTKLFSDFSETEIKAFTNEEVETARKWIFPSRFPQPEEEVRKYEDRS
jgi:hypothetical protein